MNYLEVFSNIGCNIIYVFNWNYGNNYLDVKNICVSILKFNYVFENVIIN